MRHEFRLADIGEGLEEAEIVRWLVTVGDQVARDQPLVEVMTDKSNAELPAPEAGTILELSGVVGDVLNVGELIAVIDTTETDMPAVPAPGAAPPVPAGPAAGTDPAPLPAATPDAAVPRPKASPSTRRVAAERDIDLATVRGTGPGGRILLSDLDRQAPPAQQATDTPSPAPKPIADPTPEPASDPQPLPDPTPEPASDPQPIPDPEPIPVPAVGEADLLSPADRESIDASDAAPIDVIPLRGIRRAVARNMAQSWSEIPHIHAFDEIDAEPLLELRSRLRATNKPAFESATPLTFFVAAVARALAAHPEANASIDVLDETITRHHQVNVGVAVATDNGLVVPVLHGANTLDFASLSIALNELVRAARDGALSRQHFRHGTVTITNFGALGGRQATPLIRPPESVIFGFGAIATRPFVIDDQVVARSTLPTVVGTDHRLLDGDITTALLQSVGSALADPLGLVL